MIYIECGNGNPENYSTGLASKLQEELDNFKELDNIKKENDKKNDNN